MTTTLRETDLLAPFTNRANWPGWDIYTEQLVNVAPGETRRPDIVMDNEFRLFVYQGGNLDERHMEQARELTGLADAVFLVIPKRMRSGSLFEARKSECERRGIGIYWSDGREYRMLVGPRTAISADPHALRRQLRHRTDELDAGRPGGGTSRETEWLDRFTATLRDQGEILMRQLHLDVPDSPFGNPTKTRNKVKRLIDSGEIRASYDTQYFRCK